MERRWRSALIGAAGAFLFAAAGHAQGVAGTYKVQFDSQIRMGPEGMQVAGRTGAVIMLEIRGDSVFGSWKPDNSQTARKLQGTVKGELVTLLSEPTERTMNLNGETVRQTVSDEFKLTIKGDAIDGTITPTAGPSGMPPVTRKVDGKREK